MDLPPLKKIKLENKITTERGQNKVQKENSRLKIRRDALWNIYLSK